MAQPAPVAPDATSAGPAAPRRPSGGWSTLRRDPRCLIAVVVLAGFVAMAVWPSLFTTQELTDCSLRNSLDGPTRGHPFGFDLMGCDYYTRAVHGARTSLTIGAAVVAAAAATAVVLGSLAGYLGGVLDAVVTRVADVWLSVPLLLGGIFFLSFLERRGTLQVVLVLSLLAWPLVLRLQRAAVMATREEEFVVAARALGAGPVRILVRHVVPNSLRPLVVHSALFTATAISAEAVLSYMGVGLQLPAVSWGLMLVTIRDRLPGNPHLLLPGVFLSAVVLALVLLSDALRHASDPTRR